MPPFKVDVSLWDIAVQWAQGASNPASSAFLNELDSLGTGAFGSAWKADNFVGYVYPKTSVGGMSGATQVFVDKPCGQNAIEGAEQSSGDGGAGGGGSSGGGGGSGSSGGASLAPGCYGDCGDHYGDVGPIENMDE